MAFTALAAGVSGLQAFTEGIGVIADNITNVNTVGFKESRSNFSTLVTETAAISSFSPGGVISQTTTVVSQQGLLQPSGSATDLAVDGAGFFVVRAGANPEDQVNSEIQYTRAGSFSPDSDGFLRNTAGLSLLGYPLDIAGNIPANSQDLSLLQPINISNLNGFGEATQNVALRVNLQSSTPIVYDSSAITGTTTATDYQVGQLALGLADPNGLPADFETNVQLFDSLGGGQTATISYLRTGPSQFSYEIFFADASQADATQHTTVATAADTAATPPEPAVIAGATGLIAAGTLTFNDDATIDLGNSTLYSVGVGAAGVPDFATNLLNAAGNQPLAFTYANTATSPANRAPGSITFDFGTDGAADGISQFDSPSALISSSVDGALFGNVAGVAIGENGDVTALFDNGLSVTPFRLPIATFPNADGLSRLQGNAYGLSSLSGLQALQEPGEGGAGTVAPNALELSTVDLANEFSELIRIQRAFSASTRIITTSDEILAELNSI